MPDQTNTTTCGEPAAPGGWFRCTKPAGHNGDRHHTEAGGASLTWGYVPTPEETDATGPAPTDHPGVDLVDRHLMAAADYHGPATTRQEEALRIVDALTAAGWQAPGPARPYADADVQRAHDAFARAWAVHERAHPLPEGCATTANPEDCCDEHGIRAALDALAAAGRLAPLTPDPAEGQPTCKCPMLDVSTIADLPGTRMMPDLDAVCPLHGKPVGHVLDVDALGWTIHHPTSCAISPHVDGSVRIVCLIEDLAREQLDDRIPPAGRYETHACRDGHRLLIGFRLDDDAALPTGPRTRSTCYCEDPAGRLYGHPSGNGLVCGQQSPAPDAAEATKG